MCSETRVRRDFYKFAFTPNGRTGGVGAYIRESICHEMVSIEPGKFTWGLQNIEFEVTLKGDRTIVRAHVPKSNGKIQLASDCW